MLKEKRATKQMGQRGFTIIETLIVLVVTAGLFISVAAEISNREKNTEFGQSIQNVKSQIDQFVNQVSIGYYPNGKDFTCTSDPSVPSSGLSIAPVASVGTAKDQGSNQGCIFIGKILHFSTGGVGSTAAHQIYGYAIAGKQIGINGSPIDTIDAAIPAVLASSTSSTDYSSEIQTFALQYGLKIAYACYGNCVPAAGNPTPLSPSNPTGSLAFVSVGGTLATGSQAVNLLPIVGNGSSINNNSQTEVGDITNFFAMGNLNAQLNPANGAHICFVGGNGRSGLINIGDTGNALSVTVSIKSTATCQ